jgi:hypothetical protein
MTIHISFGVSDDPLAAYAVVRNLLRAGFSVVRCRCGIVGVVGQPSRQLLSRLRRAVSVLGIRCDVFTSCETVDRSVQPD